MWRTAIVAGALILLLGCSESPTGRNQLTLLPSEQVATLGARSFAALKQATPIEADHRINALVECVADAILGVVPGDERRWEVVVFRDPDANAFALPGGKIGVNTGLLQVADSADELAAVIGHEVGHVLANHSNERLSQEFALQAILSLVYSFISDQGSIADDIAMQALGLGSELGVLLPYSRTHEREADVIGVELMARAGFDPRASLALWNNMSRAARGRLPELLSTHPSPESRLENLEEEVGSAMAVYQEARAQGERPRCS